MTTILCTPHYCQRAALEFLSILGFRILQVWSKRHFYDPWSLFQKWPRFLFHSWSLSSTSCLVFFPTAHLVLRSKTRWCISSNALNVMFEDVAHVTVLSIPSHLWKLFRLFLFFFPTFSSSVTRLWSASQGRMDQPLPFPCTSLNKRSAWCDFKGTGRSAFWQLESGFGQMRAWERLTWIIRWQTVRQTTRTAVI